VPIFPVFFLGPLALLLVVSHPRTTREWFWIAVSAGALVAWFRLPDSLSQEAVRAAAVLFVGAFVTLAVAGVRSLFTRAMLGAGLAALATVGWFVAFHLRFEALQTDIIAQIWDESRQIWTSLPVTPPPAATEILVTPTQPDLAHQLVTAATGLAVLSPAILTLVALLGAWLASTWYHRITRTPIVTAPPPLADFRFNDQLVWLLVVSVGLTLASTSRTIHLVTENVLVVVLATYWLRGLAVIRTALRRASPLVIGILILIMFPMLAFVLVGLTLLGVADTWLDFRRRMAPRSGVPT
jgi:uncharacterized protein YybS (DUF2232 family)